MEDMLMTTELDSVYKKTIILNLNDLMTMMILKMS